MSEVRLAPWQFAACFNPFDHFAMYGGVATGKTFTGSHFSINQIRSRPDLSGFIGANTYDQLSQATLKELFYWLQEYGFEFVFDRRPPQAWRPRPMKDFHNVLSVRYEDFCVGILTRVLSDENPLRGVEFSWYWIDETRDTPEITHDVILSRLRESEHVKGLITTTTNGESWDYKRFVRGNDGSRTYGSMHVKTAQSLDAGIITDKYYQTLLKSYSPLVALQELDAQHVNILGGRAYYAGGPWNQKRVAPWGDAAPNPERPLIVGCDFNYAPAPCVWMVGQVGPATYGPNGEWWGDCVHWFGEISEVETSTSQMTRILLGRFPDFFYRIFGDASGNRGTTSNAGQTDYHLISNELNDAGVSFSIDSDQANPHVKDRVENVNRLLKNALGDVCMTYDPSACPQFDGDIRIVGWKQTVQMGRGKLENGGDLQRTHATDAAGYAAWKLLPPGRRGIIIENNQSPIRQELRNQGV